MEIEICASQHDILLQDLGRFGYTYYGVSTSGAADRSAYMQAHRLLGLENEIPSLEITMGNVIFCADHDLFFIVTGAPVVIDIAGLSYFSHRVLYADAHTKVTISAPLYGLRSYLQIRGCIQVDKVLGSYSRDTLSKIGPDTLSGGSIIAVEQLNTDFSPSSYLPQHYTLLDCQDVVLEIFLVLTDAEIRVALLRQMWIVQELSDRIAIRVQTPIEKCGDSEDRKDLVMLGSSSAVDHSVPICRGSVQLAPSGEIIIFLADHPTTGGYANIGFIGQSQCDLVAQLRSGAKIQWRLIGKL